MKFLQRWKQTALHNKALVLTGIIVAGGTLFYAGTAVFQIYMMKYTAEQTTLQMNRFIFESNRIANSIEKGLEENKTVVQKSFEQNKKSLDATIEVARRDQRAWVGLVEVEAPPLKDADDRLVYIKEGSVVALNVVIVNSGKSPALNVKILAKIITIPANTRFSPDFSEKPCESIAVIQPQVRVKIPISTMFQIANYPVYAIKNGRDIVFLFGKITYEDIFGRSHFTTFCAYLTSDLGTFLFYDAYNEAN